jgi:organic hydroperoxide reductase OsmC/OhrA
MKSHNYTVALEWTGNTGKGTAAYSVYERSHTLQVTGKPIIDGSSDPSFRGDATKYNPEEMLVASISSCHMLWYLHFCAEQGIIVTAYTDNAMGTMIEHPDGSGKFTEVILYPIVTITSIEQMDLANQLHRKAHEYCFIANSCNFPIRHEPSVRVK